MRPSKAIPLTRAEKLEMYLGLPEKDTKRVNEQADYSGIETALTDAGRRFRESASAVKSKTAWRFRTPTRKVILVAAALAILLILAIACVCTGFLSRALNFGKKSSMNSITLPSGVTKKSRTEAPAVEPEVQANKIVFLSARDIDPNETRNLQAIYSMNPDGSEQTPLTEVGENYTPDISPDGSKIAYSHDFSIWIMNIDGSGNRELVHGDRDEEGYGGYYDPVWSPDGTKIAFHWEEMHPRLYVYDVNSGELFTDIGPANGVFDADWLLDNRTIIFQSGRGEIGLVDYDGSNSRTLCASTDYVYWSLVVSPDGKGYAFNRERIGSHGKDQALLVGYYPGMSTQHITSTSYSRPARLTNDGVIFVDVGQDGWDASIKIVDTRSGEQWTLCQHNGKTGEVTSSATNHTGEAFYLAKAQHDTPLPAGLITEPSFIFRVDMDGTVTRITNSGADSSPTWR